MANKLDFDNDVTPSKKIINKAKNQAQVKDVDDRIINFKERLLPSEQCDMLIALGPEHSETFRLRMMASVVFRIINIDGLPWVTPSNMSELKKALDEVGDEGFSAVWEYDNKKAEEKAAERKAKEAKAPVKTDE